MAEGLPALVPVAVDLADRISIELSIPRAAFADRTQVGNVLDQLPRLLPRIPPALRNAPLARMCAALAVGLFDAAVNYAWNHAVAALRDRVRRFGLVSVGEIRKANFEESDLLDLRDAELLRLCVELNLISEEGFFFLDQARATRNEYSVAHPSEGMLDDYQFLSVLNNCIKYAIEPDHIIRGINQSQIYKMIRSATLKQSQLDFLVSEIGRGIEIQKNAVLRGLHGIYCDSAETQTARANSFALASSVGRSWPATGKAEILDQHSTFVAFGHDDKEKASNEFLSKLKLLASLPEIQRHSLVIRACKLLVGAHEAFNNFYNEPPFAERLAELARQGAVPDSAREVYVRTVIYVGIGNRYGVSHAAQPYYLELVKRFTPLEVDTSDNPVVGAGAAVGSASRGVPSVRRGRLKAPIGLLARVRSGRRLRRADLSCRASTIASCCTPCWPA